jgi:AcrR family transcriptional regulator
MPRRSADERRQHVIDAAIATFADAGYHGASTTMIAERAGISQPYIYALFTNKRIRDRLLAAAEDEDGPEQRLRAMGDAYLQMIGNSAEVRCQLQAYAAAGDPALQGAIRDEFLHLFESVQGTAGVSREEAAFFFAGGIFLAIASALGVPREYWPGGGEPPAG